MVIAYIIEKKHASPGLTQQVNFRKIQVFSQGFQLMNPGLCDPEFRMTFNPGIAQPS